MKSIYEVTRPIINTITFGGQIDIPMMYAYELYRPEVRIRFDKATICAAWEDLSIAAAVDEQARKNFLLTITRGGEYFNRTERTFLDRLGKSSLTYLVNSSSNADYGQVLFNVLIKNDLLDGTNNEQAMNYTQMIAWAVELVQHLDDTTHTFTDEDIDVFTHWVEEILSLLDRDSNPTA